MFDIRTILLFVFFRGGGGGGVGQLPKTSCTRKRRKIFQHTKPQKEKISRKAEKFLPAKDLTE